MVSSKKGIWQNVAEQAIGGPDLEWVMINATHRKVHPDACGTRGGNNRMGLNTKTHLAIDKRGCPVE